MSRMESLDMEQARPAQTRRKGSGGQPSACGLSPILHIRLNTALNLAVLGLMISACNIEPWFSYKGTEFSLVGLNLKDMGGWKEYGDFQVRCTADNLERYKDYRDDCEGLDSYEYAGILALVFLCVGMTINTFNAISSANVGWGCRLGQFDVEVRTRQFPHLLGPITYFFGVLLWLTMIKVAFLPTFSAEVGLILATIATLLSFLVAYHYKRFKTILDSKPTFTSLITP